MTVMKYICGIVGVKSININQRSLLIHANTKTHAFDKLLLKG